MENMEIWKDVIGYEGLYQISNLGNVKSLNYARKNKQQILKGVLNNRGYLTVSLHKKGVFKRKTIHQLVAIAFLNHIPCGFNLVVNHINFNKQDNRVENLEIVTNRENSNQKHLKSTSKYTGVRFRKKTNKWESAIQINGSQIYLGVFISEEEASQYYENALKAHLNNEEIIIKLRDKSSKYKGVVWYKKYKKWCSRITINGKRICLGYFENEIDAHNAIKKALCAL